MRRLPVVVTLAIVGGALAGTPPPSASSAPTWADWVGDWEGKLRWTSCIVDGEPSATLPIDAIDGVLAIDLTRAGSALGPTSLTEAGQGWDGRFGDAAVHVSRSHDGLDVTVELGSGCAMHAALHQASMGIAACDRLAAWARIESRCTKLTRPPREDIARLARQRSEWTKALGEARVKLAAQCDTRAVKVQDQLVAAGCAPNPDPLIGMRGAECQALRQTAAKLGRCGRLPPDVQDSIARRVPELVVAAQTADAATLAAVESQCRELRDRLVVAARQSSCPP